MHEWDRPRTSSQAEKAGVIAKLREILEPRTEILFAYLHGSFVEALPFHDIDVAVFLDEQQATGKDAFEYENSLSVAFTRALQLEVDVRVINHAPLGFQFNVTKGQLLVSRDEKRRLAFVERTWIMYWDFRPISEMMLREALK